MKCIILAGGLGERLWPVSRDLYPKSLLKFDDGKSYIQNVFEIASSIVIPKNIITVTNIRQTNDIKIQLCKYYRNPVIISEPMVKNTTSAIASALEFMDENKDEIVVILPVDFIVKKIENLKDVIKKSQTAAKNGYIVALGIKPQYIDSGFGYIKAGENIKSAIKVKKFIEKPDIELIKKHLNSDDFYINSGIYIAKKSVLKEHIAKYAPDSCLNFSKDMFDENNKIKYEYYEKLNAVSIDYSVMEKTDKLVFNVLDASWSDYGSWQNIHQLSDKDKKNNVVKGNVIIDNVKDSFIYSNKELVAVSNVNNNIIIETEDAVLVCNKDKASEISKLVHKLKENNQEEALTGKTVYRPWGYYTCLNGGEGWLTKLIQVSPKHRLSLQSHNYRSEHWVVLDGIATVVLENDIHNLKKGQSIDIPIKAKHSLQNNTNNCVKILEVQKGEYIGEDDIVRYEDMYGRVN